MARGKDASKFIVKSKGADAPGMCAYARLEAPPRSGHTGMLK